MRRIGIFLFFLMISLRAFSLDISTGFGGSVFYDMVLMETESPLGSANRTTSIPNLAFGVFFDLDYLVVDCSLAYSLEGTSILEDFSGTTDTDIKDSFTYFRIQGLLKYPIQLGSIKVFPTAGVEYRQLSEAQDEDGNDIFSYIEENSDFLVEQWYVRGGVGMDVPLNDLFFIRALTLFGYKLLGKFEKDFISTVEDLGGTASMLSMDFGASLYFGYSY